MFVHNFIFDIKKCENKVGPDSRQTKSCALAVKKASQMAGHVYRTVTHKSVQTVVPLYKALFRPHLETGVLLTGIVTLSKEEHSKHRKGTTKGDQNDSLHLCPKL